MKKLDFNVPFSGFNSLTFPNVLSSFYIYYENIPCSDEYDCPAKEGKGCNGCGNCNDSPDKKQEYHYFLFDTVSGRSSLRPSFAWENDADHDRFNNFDNSRETVDFLLKFCGYRYEIQKEDFMRYVKASIDCGVPVIARMKDGAKGAFRLVTGYDSENTLYMANPGNAQQKPEKGPACDEIEEIILVKSKTEPEYQFVDGLKKIRGIIEANIENHVWDNLIKKFKYWDENLPKAEFDEIRARIKRICDISWYNFNCHNFAEVFRNRREMYADSLTGQIKDKAFDRICDRVSESYDNSHTRNWQVIALNDCRDWTNRRYNELEWGYCTCVAMCLEKLKQYDEEVLDAVKDAITILGGNGTI